MGVEKTKRQEEEEEEVESTFSLRSEALEADDGGEIAISFGFY